MNDTVQPQISTTCRDCKHRVDGYFCNLPDHALEDLRSKRLSATFPRGATLFMEGQPADGVYLLCSGHVKLSTYSEEGRAIILRIAEPGEVVGLSGNISGTPHEATAVVTDECRADFIRRDDFLNFIQTYHEAALNALRQLSNNYHKAHEQICSLGLSLSAGDKLARLLLQWYDRTAGGGSVRISRHHTHGEIAEMIGTSRETVTRLLTDFRDRDLIVLSRGEIYIPDRARLKAAIGTKHRNGNGHK